MPSRIHLSAILLIAATLWAAFLSFADVPLSTTWFRPFSPVLSVLLLLFVAFDLWAWRFRLLQGWFVPRPDVRGTWQVVLRSNWKDPATGQTIAPITTFLVIRQTFSMISMRMLTAESSSELVAAAIGKASDGTYQISGVYLNQPKLSVRERSPMHYGAFLLSVEGSPVESLSGHYWTDRETKGEMMSVARRGAVFARFERASRAFGL
jgi:hypothetical protein